MSDKDERSRSEDLQKRLFDFFDAHQDLYISELAQAVR
jgi:Ca2+-binding EF-hand superfamily protein